MDYKRMAKLHDYVYSTPPNSSERERRLNELSEADQAALYDYAVGILSGRIRKSDYEQEDNSMLYEHWRRLKQSNDPQDFMDFINFGRLNPSIASDYENRERVEQKKREQIMAIQDRNERQDAIARNLALFQ